MSEDWRATGGDPLINQPPPEPEAAEHPPSEAPRRPPSALLGWCWGVLSVINLSSIWLDDGWWRWLRVILGVGFAVGAALVIRERRRSEDAQPPSQGVERPC